jgi:arylsulfatase
MPSLDLLRPALVATLFVCGATFLSSAPLAAAPPNVVVIVADDLGWSDLGCYGGEIATPRLDRLAAGGLRYVQFHNTGRCWPSRAALLTGYYPQQIRRDTVPGVPSGGRGTRPVWARLLPDLLRPLGYRAYHSGKWHVDGRPLAGGFDRSYDLADHDRFFGPKSHTQDDKPLPPVPADTPYYATTAVADHALRCLREHAAQHKDRPFFSYVAFTSPHFPLHAPAEDVARYAEKYRVGWEAIRRERWERIRKLGLVAGELSAVEREIGPPYPFPDAIAQLGPGEVNRPVPWDTLNEEQRRFQAAKMSVHAAMVDRMDREIGRLVDELHAQGVLEDTLLMFVSDNGASAEIMVRGDGHDPQAAPGSARSYLCLGPGWSNVANTPFRRHKTWTHEGGIATPLVVHWPQGIAARGEVRRVPGHLIDLVPTILEAAGVRPPETWQGTPVPPAPGRSLVATFAEDADVPRDVPLWWLHEGNRALREGQFKLVASGKEDRWELFDVQRDPAETDDLAARRPEIVERLRTRWERMRDEFFEQARRDVPPSKTPVPK